MQPQLSTADVPSQYLKAAYLVGHVPFRVLQSDPRILYALYIPPEHYNARGTTKLSLLVYVHGTRRDLSYLYDELQAFADSTQCAILAPLFPAGFEGPMDLESYKTLKSPTLRSDLALLGILAESGLMWPGIETSKVFLLGFSGGGQFAHRFALVHPGRLAAVSVGAPGSVTILDESATWQNGIADAESVFGHRVEVSLLRDVAIQLIIGGEDHGPHGGEEFVGWMAQMKHKVGAVGGTRETVPQNRVESLQALTASTHRPCRRTF